MRLSLKQQVCALTADSNIKSRYSFPLVDGMDYVTMDIMFSFDMCETKSCINISVVDDSVTENDEVFNIFLISPNPRFDYDTAIADITIRDNEGRVINLWLYSQENINNIPPNLYGIIICRLCNF